MWHAWLGATLTKAALPIIGGAVALVLTLSAALWWTNGRLSDTRDRLAVAKAGELACVQANESQRFTIQELRTAAEQNRAQADDALRRQEEAINRVRELESRGTDTVERVIRIADGDACAAAPIPERLRAAAQGGNAD